MIFVVVSTGHFDPLIKKCESLKNRFDFFGQIGSSTFTPSFPFIRMATPEIIEDHMKRSELVISHAGTGMLSMLYSLKKRSVVIPKQIRYGEMNNGQVELATKWGELGMATLCMDIDDLAEKIDEALKASFSFPTFPSLGLHLRTTRLC